MSFKDFKKNRSKFTDTYNKKVADLNANPYEDDRFWQPTVDKAGNGLAIIRFLPAKDGEDIPFVRIFSHNFKGPGGWLIENCLTTRNEKCPVCEENTLLWNSGIEDNKAIVRGVNGQAGRKRKLSYISNILVVKDKDHPENDGKVFLYKYGAKIFGKIEDASKPEFEDSQVINPFDMWEGANFKLKIANVEGYRNYDKSIFEAPTQVDKSEAVMEEIYNKLYSLQAFVADDQFKSYDALKGRFDKTLGNSTKTRTETSDGEKSPVAEAKAPGKTRKAKPAPETQEGDDVPFDLGEADGDDKLAQFQRLAQED
jgi:hypothetical protein